MEIQSGAAKGLRMNLSPRCDRGYLFGTHERELQDALARIVRPGMTIYNVGGHTGFFALLLARLSEPNGTVVAFEPNPRVRARLTENVALNSLERRILVLPLALGDVDEIVPFSLSMSDTQGRFADLPHVRDGHVIDVRCCQLDTLLDSGSAEPDVLVIDVEHAEGRVLRGMGDFLERRRPQLFIELHGPQAIREVWDALNVHGYVLRKAPGAEPCTRREDLSYGQYYASHPGNDPIPA